MMDVNAVRLQQAVLCVNCDTISDSPHDDCMICGSRSLLPLSRVLGEARAAFMPVVGEVPAATASISDKVLVLTSPVPHRLRRRRRIAQG